MSNFLLYLFSEATNPELLSSFEVGYRMMERDRKRAQCLFRTQSLGKKSLDIPEETSPILGNFEPDWSKFESVYANGKPCLLLYQHWI